MFCVDWPSKLGPLAGLQGLSWGENDTEKRYSNTRFYRQNQHTVSDGLHMTAFTTWIHSNVKPFLILFISGPLRIKET